MGSHEMPPDIDDSVESIIEDPFCNPDFPSVVEFREVSAAAYKIKNGVERTPCTKSRMSKGKIFNLCKS